MIAVNGEAVDSEGIAAQRRELGEQMREAGQAGDFVRMNELEQSYDALPDYDLDISVRDTTGTNISGDPNVAQGRALTVADVGQPVMLMRQSDLEDMGVPLGTVITVRIDEQDYDLEIVGSQNDSSLGAFGEALVPPGVLPAQRGLDDIQFTLAEIEPEHLDAALLDLSSLPLVFSIDVSFIDGLIRRFIDQFSALPILVGLLSLGAAAVIMANTVALATLERRRQIGILKAVGLKGRRVLGVMLLENLLVSLLGGLLGVGLSALGVVIMSRVGMQTTLLVPNRCHAGCCCPDCSRGCHRRCGDSAQCPGRHQRTRLKCSTLRLMSDT